MNSLLPSENHQNRRQEFMATQSFQAVRRLNEAGAPLALILANPAWQSLMDRIDSNISERQASLDTALNKISMDKRAASDIDGEVSESTTKRARLAEGADLASRKQALLAKINKIEGAPSGSAGGDEEYEAYRRQCWVQYYEWMEKQKRGVDSSAKPGDQEVSAAGGQTSEDEDEEIHNALLGLS
jgi:hypothetical protein